MSNLFHILARNENEPNRAEKVAVIIKNDDLLNGHKVFFAFRENSIYKPYDEFKPELKSGGHKLSGQIVQNYFDMIPCATDAYNKLRSVLENNGGQTNSVELDNVKHALELSKNKVREQAEKIAVMSVNQISSNNGQAEQMQKLLLEQQAQTIKMLSDMKPRIIEIKNNGKSNFVQADAVHEKFEMILECIAEDEPVFLTGPAGTGKSKLAEQVADALQLDFYPCSALSQEYKVTGFIDANGTYHETQFYKAFKYGGMICIDEIDASDPTVPVVINTAIAQKYFDFPNGKIDAHKDFRIICAGNTTGNGADLQYVGRNQLDASTLDRFAQIDIDYSPQIELNIARGDADLVEFAQNVRRTADENGISLLVSYRAIGRIKKLEEKIDLSELIKIGLIKGMASDDVRQLVRNMTLSSSNKYFKALKTLA